MKSGTNPAVSDDLRAARRDADELRRLLAFVDDANRRPTRWELANAKRLAARILKVADEEWRIRVRSGEGT